jgi:putative aldouronate transport system substrate-binding protein
LKDLEVDMKKIIISCLWLAAAAMLFAAGSSDADRAGTSTAARPSGITASGYPIVTDGSVTLRYWTPINAASSKYIKSYAENTAYQEIEKRTGIKIEFIHPASGMEREQFNLLMASGDLPDVIACANFYKGGEFQGLYDGFFMDLTDSISQNAPDYWKLIQSDDEFMREISDGDGKICAFYAYKSYGDPPFDRILLRKDVLAELGKDIPRTIADYEDLFAAMLAKGITPFMPHKSGYVRQFIGAFGVLSEFYKDENGKILYGQVTQEFKQYLELMNRWYSRGYISKDFTSVDSNQINTLFDTKKIGMFISAIVANFNRGALQGFEVTSAPYPRLRLGDQLHHENTNIFPVEGRDTMMAVVSAKSKYPEAAIRWLNYGYTATGSDIFNWGVEGLNYNVVNGKKVYNDLMLNNPIFGTEETNYIYKIHFAPKRQEFGAVCNPNLLKSPNSLASRFLWADDPNVDSILNLPPYSTTTAEQNLRTRTLTEISTYADEMVLKFITGAERLDRFDQFVATINSMGLPELIKSEQGAYDRYLTKKK